MDDLDWTAGRPADRTARLRVLGGPHDGRTARVPDGDGTLHVTVFGTEVSGEHAVTRPVDHTYRRDAVIRKASGWTEHLGRRWPAWTAEPVLSYEGIQA